MSSSIANINKRNIYIYIYTNPSARAVCQQKFNFKRDLTGLNSEFSFSYAFHTKVKEHSLSHYLLISGRKIFGFLPFPRVLALYKMQTASSRIWTRVAMSIIYDFLLLHNKHGNSIE